MSEPPMLRVEGLRKSFGTTSVLKGIALEVRRGEKLAIIGPSGSGKSTLLRCMNFLGEPDEGSVWIDGAYFKDPNAPAGVRPSTKHVSALRQQIGMVFQRFNLFANATALGNVAAPLRVVRGLSADEATRIGERYLAKVGLGDKLHAYPAHLSGGQQQRVAIARALAMEPKVMLFDETTSALDPELVGEVLAVIRQLAAEGMTMVLVTHEMRFARDVADEVAFMVDGQILEQGPPAMIFRRPQHARTREFLEQFLDVGQVETPSRL